MSTDFTIEERLPGRKKDIEVLGTEMVEKDVQQFFMASRRETDR